MCVVRAPFIARSRAIREAATADVDQVGAAAGVLFPDTRLPRDAVRVLMVLELAGG